MEMALVWNDVKSFRQHIEDMKTFSRFHRNITQGTLNQLKAMPFRCNGHSPGKTAGCNFSISSRGKPTLVPIWEIEPPRGSQN